MTSTTITTANPLHKRIIGVLNAGHLAPHEQEQVTDAVGGMLYQNLLLDLFGRLPVPEQYKLKQLMEAHLEDEIADLLNTYIPRVDQVITQSLTQSLQTYRNELAI